MRVRLSAYFKDKFILVQWYMELKNGDDNLASENALIENQFSNKMMVLRFDVVHHDFVLNLAETFKYKYLDETIYMGSRQNFIQYVKDYFTQSVIQEMLEAIIEDSNARAVDKENLSKYLVKNDKRFNASKSSSRVTYRYSLNEDENDSLIEALNYLIDKFSNEGDKETLDKISNLKKVLNNVKLIELSQKKTNATTKAVEVNKERSRSKIRTAYEKLKKENKKITIYTIAKEAKVSHPTAKKYIEIFQEDLV